MLFRFHVSLSAKDYYEFNKFHMTKSHYGKKTIAFSRILIAVIMLAVILILLIGERFSAESFIYVIPLFVAFCVVELCIVPFSCLMLKIQLKLMKKTGKMPYSSSSVVEFFDDKFVETTVNNKTEYTYSAIERICIIKDKIIYVYINNIMAYLIPICSFESQEQYNSFLEFIKIKCNNIDVY